jgi:hypothetical protein
MEPVGTDGPADAPAPASAAEALGIAVLHRAPLGLLSLPDLVALRSTSTDLLRAVGAAPDVFARLDLGVVDDFAAVYAASLLLRGLRTLVELRATADPERLAGLLATCAPDTGALHGSCRVVSRMTCVAAPAGLLRLEVAFAPASDGPAGALGISRMDGYEAEQPGGRRAWWGRVGGPPAGVRAAAQAVLEHGPAADICFVSEVRGCGSGWGGDVAGVAGGICGSWNGAPQRV